MCVCSRRVGRRDGTAAAQDNTHLQQEQCIRETSPRPCFTFFTCFTFKETLCETSQRPCFTYFTCFTFCCENIQRPTLVEVKAKRQMKKKKRKTCRKLGCAAGGRMSQDRCETFFLVCVWVCVCVCVCVCKCVCVCVRYMASNGTSWRVMWHCFNGP